MAEDFDTEGNSILRGVAQIGPAKPVGYLPLHTIRDILRIEPRVLAQDSAAKGLSAVLFGPTQCCIKSGALYSSIGSRLSFCCNHRDQFCQQAVGLSIQISS